MGLEPSDSDNTTPALNLPMFFTKKMNRTQYRGALSSWEEIFCGFAEADREAKERIDLMGLMVYMACHEEKKVWFRE